MTRYAHRLPHPNANWQIGWRVLLGGTRLVEVVAGVYVDYLDGSRWLMTVRDVKTGQEFEVGPRMNDVVVGRGKGDS